MVLKSSILFLGLLLSVSLLHSQKENQIGTAAATDSTAVAKRSLSYHTNAIAKKIENETGAFGLAASSGLALSASLYLAIISFGHGLLGTLTVMRSFENNEKFKYKLLLYAMVIKHTAFATATGILAVLLGKAGYDWAKRSYVVYQSGHKDSKNAPAAS